MSHWRALSAEEIAQLSQQGCTCTDWSRMQVADGFRADRVRNGSIELLPDGHTARFTPSPDYQGAASFRLTSRDQSLSSRTRSMTWALVGKLPASNSIVIIAYRSCGGICTRML